MYYISITVAIVNCSKALLMAVFCATWSKNTINNTGEKKAWSGISFSRASQLKSSQKILEFVKPAFKDGPPTF